MSIRSPPPKKRSPLEEYYENYGKRRATDVSKWKVTLTGALPGVNQSVQNNNNQTCISAMRLSLSGTVPDDARPHWRKCHSPNISGRKNSK